MTISITIRINILTVNIINHEDDKNAEIYYKPRALVVTILVVVVAAAVVEVVTVDSKS